MTVFHVDAHANLSSSDRIHSTVADQQAQIDITESPNLNVDDLARWVHLKAGHLGAQATYSWAQQRGLPLTLSSAHNAVLECPLCQYLKSQTVPQRLTSSEESCPLRYGK